MHAPRQFREERPEILARAVRGVQLAALITPGPERLHISHVPMALKEGDKGARTLETHVARPNPHWTLAGAGVPSVPNVEAWVARPQERPACREYVMVPFDDLKGKLDC